MFGIFNSKPECPVRPNEKEWIEKGLLWYRKQLGDAYLSKHSFLLPSELISPSYKGTEQEAQDILAKLCKHLEIDPQCVRLHFFKEEEYQGPEGIIEGWQTEGSHRNRMQKDGMLVFNIYIGSNRLTDPEGLIYALVYHMIGIYYDIPFAKLKYTRPLMELSSVINGLGILWANSIIRYTKWKGVSHYGWKISSIGILTQPMMGYALALMAKFRDEKNPEWSNHLCADVKAYFKKSAKYLNSTTDKIEFLSKNISAAEITPPDYLHENKGCYDNGPLSSVSEMKNGYKDGLTVYYHRNGKLWAEWIYRNNTPWTAVSNYDQKGNAREKGTLKEGNGVLYSYNADDSVAFIQDYSNGKPVKNELNKPDAVK